MRRTSQTKLAVLGALSVEPMTGYVVRQSITETLGHFWSESFGQIYPALAELEKEGAIRRSNPGRTSGSMFEITPAGSETLRQLLAEPFESTPPRNALLLRMFFGRHLGPAACRTLLVEALTDAERRRVGLAAIRAEIENEPATQDTPYWTIALNAGERSTEALIDWARESILALDTSTDAPSSERSTQNPPPKGP
jgi:DNA-binding PadR family transcriptional regulator